VAKQNEDTTGAREAVSRNNEKFSGAGVSLAHALHETNLTSNWWKTGWQADSRSRHPT